MRASVVATVKGADSVNLVLGKNCPKGGHGEIQLSGTYTYPTTSEDLFSFEGSSLLVKEVTISTPATASTKAEKVNVELRRRNCPTVLDSADMVLTDVAIQGGKQSSKNGLFEVSYDKGQVHISGTELLVGK